MADVKNFGLTGISDDVQFGKGGGRVVYNSGANDFRFTSDGTTLVNIQVATPTGANEVATKEYVDSVAAGLDPKASVDVATTARLGGTYTSNGGTAGNGQFTGISTSIDGELTQTGDRVLVKNEQGEVQNATVADGGTGYAVSDVLTVVGGTGTAATLTVTGVSTGVITTISVTTEGDYTVFPTSPVTVTGGTGTGATFNLTESTVRNGIYVATGTTTLERAEDHDGNPGSEISGGNFTFVESGTVGANTGWVLQGTGNLTPNIDPQIWVLFSSSGDIIAGTGLSKVGDTLNLDFAELSSVGVDTLAGSDEIIVLDGATESRITVTNFLNTFNVPNAITTDGIVVRTAADTYASRSVVAATTSAQDGLAVTNGNGASGDIIVGLDINGMTPVAAGIGELAVGDKFAFYNQEGPGNLSVTLGQIRDFVNASVAGNQIAEGNSDITVTDAGIGSITTTVDGTLIQTTAATGTTFNSGTVTISDLTQDEAVLFINENGTIEQDADFTYNSSSNQLKIGTGINDGTIILSDDIFISSGSSVLQMSAPDDIILNAGATDHVTLNVNNDAVGQFTADASAINGFQFNAGATGNAATISIESTTNTPDANVDIVILPNGTGVISVVGTTNYEANVTADDDIPNKKYVDDAIAASVTPGSLGSVSGTVDFTSATTQNLGTATGIPAGATILDVTFDVTAASDAVTTVTVEGPGGTYMASSENDPETVGIYLADLRTVNGGAAGQATATVATAGTVGSATVIITYRNA